MHNITEQCSTEQKNWPNVTEAIAVILYFHTYASNRLHYICRLIAMLTCLTILSSLGTYILWNKPPNYKFIITDQYGKVLKVDSLNDSIHPNDYVIKWVVDAITRLYSVDYVNYRAQLQSQRHNLTTRGWNNFQDAMKISGNFQAILGNQYITTAVPTSSGTITKTGSIQGRFAWKVKIPLKIVYRASNDANKLSQNTITQNLAMLVTVIRVPRHLNSKGLGIRAIVAEQTESTLPFTF